MVSPRPLSRRLIGHHACALRRSTLPHIFTYREMHDDDPSHAPFSVGLRLLPQLAWRWLTDRRGQGNALITGLLKGCIDHGCRLDLQAEVRRLTRDCSGRVTGVELDGRSIAARRGVLLATGGFEWDETLRTRNFAGPLDRIGSPRGNTGDGQRMAAEAGAQLDRMDQANVYPTIPTVYEGKLHGLPITFQAEPHAIVVNRHGQRFVSEYDFNIGEALDRRQADGSPLHLPAWVVADRRFLSRSLPLRVYARRLPGWMRRADSIVELARAIGVPGSRARRDRRALQLVLCGRP